MNPKALKNDRTKFENPGIYKIIVEGSLAENWSDRLAGMRITASETDNNSPTATLVGHLRDQAQLSGVLNSLYELHLPIRLVEYLHKNGDHNLDK